MLTLRLLPLLLIIVLLLGFGAQGNVVCRSFLFFQLLSDAEGGEVEVGVEVEVEAEAEAEVEIEVEVEDNSIREKLLLFIIAYVVVCWW